ncbi:MAG: hypothetical protein ACP5R0_01405 [Thermoplasmata archaeon]
MTLKSRLRFNGVDIKLDVNAKGEYESLKITNERIPSKEEFARIIRKVYTRRKDGKYLNDILGFNT